MYRNRYFRDPIRLMASIIVLILFAIYTIFFKTYTSIICAGSYCNLYTQTGVLGFKHQYDKFKRSDVVDLKFRESYHSTKRSRHTDFTPILVMKDGSEYELPFKYCYSRSKAEYIVREIRGNEYYKETSKSRLW